MIQRLILARESMLRPVALVISGLPCSGKSTLALHLQMRLGWPLLAEDAFKESLFDTLGVGDRDWSRRISTAAYALLFEQAKALLECGHSVILEANFRPGEHTDAFAKLATSSMRFAQVHCRAEAQTLVTRYRERVTVSSKQRHPGHVDALAANEIELELARAEQLPLSLPRAQPTEAVVCDTSLASSLVIERAASQIIAVVDAWQIPTAKRSAN